MEDVFEALKNADSKTLAIFDVDMVLIQPSDPAFQMANMKRFSAISKRIMKEIPPHKLMLFFSLMTLSSDSVLIHDKTPEWLAQIIQNGIPTMALTANLTRQVGNIQKMEEWRVNDLQRHGIDFSKTAPCKVPLIFDHLAPYRGNYSTYLNGILFVNGLAVSKGEAFLSFLEKSGFYPDKVIFIDDREENLKSLEEALQKLDRSIEYQGLHYLGAQKYPSKMISEKEFENRWQNLAVQVKEMN